MAKTASINGHGAPSQVSSWTAENHLSCKVTAPAGVTQADGTQPMWITDVRLYLRGESGSTSAHFQIAGGVSPSVSIPSGGDGGGLTSWGHLSPAVKYNDSTGAVVSTLTAYGYNSVWYGWDGQAGNTISSDGGTEQSSASLTGDLTYYTGTSAARSVTIASTGSNGVTVGWTPPSDLGGYSSSQVWYDVWVATDAGITQNVKHITTGMGASSYTFTGLIPGATYYALVRCTNNVSDDAGTFSANSNIPSVTVADVPGVPTSLAATAHANSAATLDWVPPTDNGGSSIILYSIEYATDSAFTAPSEFTTASTFINITGLTPGTLYYWRVRAKNSVGYGDWSATISAHQDTTPGAPTALAVTPSTDTSSVTWTAPSDNGGTAITGYELQYATDSAFTSPTSQTGGTTTSASVVSLLPGTLYYWRVRGINGQGNGAWSATISAQQLSGGEISDGAAWNAGESFISDGATWTEAVVYISDGTQWLPSK